MIGLGVIDERRASYSDNPQSGRCDPGTDAALLDLANSLGVRHTGCRACEATYPPDDHSGSRDGTFLCIVNEDVHSDIPLAAQKGGKSIQVTDVHLLWNRRGGDCRGECGDGSRGGGGRKGRRGGRGECRSGSGGNRG